MRVMVLVGPAAGRVVEINDHLVARLRSLGIVGDAEAPQETPGAGAAELAQAAMPVDVEVAVKPGHRRKARR